MTSFASPMYIVFLILLLEHLNVTASVHTNVAQGKPANQSSLGFGGYPFYAVDGVTGGNLNSDGCMHTRHGKSWWMVDLLRVYNISTITIFKRTDIIGGSPELLKIEGSVGHPQLCPTSSTNVCVNQMGNFTGPSKTVTCDQEVMARYVTVSSNYMMMMCEVQVFGEDTCLTTEVQIENGRKRDSPSPMQNSLASSFMECSSICHRHNCSFFNYNRVNGECQTGSGLVTTHSSYDAADWDLGTIC